jgi:hypothetical protein
VWTTICSSAFAPMRCTFCVGSLHLHVTLTRQRSCRARKGAAGVPSCSACAACYVPRREKWRLDDVAVRCKLLAPRSRWSQRKCQHGLSPPLNNVLEICAALYLRCITSVFLFFFECITGKGSSTHLVQAHPRAASRGLAPLYSYTRHAQYSSHITLILNYI